MRRIFALGCIGFAALVLAQTNGSDTLASFTGTLNAAKSLDANFSVQPVGGSATNFTVNLAKPDKARIDGPSQLIVADGKTITILDKKDNSYSKQPQTAADLKDLFKSDQLSVFSPFFGGNPYKGATIKSLGVKNRKGENLNAVLVSTDAKGRKSSTFYISTSDKLAKQAEFSIKDQGVDETTIMNVRSIALDAPAANGLFAFTPPDGSREISADERSAFKWYGNLIAAEAEAKRTGKKIFVDFMASWCGPCKMLDRDVFETEEFKRMTKFFVLVKIDVDEQPDVSQAYKITAMPTQLVLDANGGELARTVGYGGAQRFYDWIGAYIK